MPFYEYQCGACGKHHEALQKVSDPPLRKCPACGKPRLKKMMSAPVFRLKGSGWYETDFKSDKESKRNLAVDKEDKPDKPAEKGESAKADTSADKAQPDAAKSESDKPTTDKSAAKTADKPAAKPTGARSSASKSRAAKSRRKTRR
jgi:putative FmdB family regulatory protein